MEKCSIMATFAIKKKFMLFVVNVEFAVVSVNVNDYEDMCYSDE